MFNLIKKLININKLFITDKKQVITPINTKKIKKILTGGEFSHIEQAWQVNLFKFAQNLGNGRF